MLPLPADYPCVTPVQYPASNPPYVPNVQLLPEATPLLVHAASSIANEAAINSGKSNARMFCYNLLSSSGWANTAFSEVVKLACDSSVIKARQVGSSPAAMLRDAVQEVLSLYTSFLVMSYPELASMLSREYVAASATNAGVYQNLQAAAAAMYMTTSSFQTQPARLGQMGRNVPPANLPPANPAAAGLVGTQQQQSVPNSRFSHSKAQVPQQKPAPAPEAVKEDPKKNVVTGDIENMNRDQHTIVYFGKKYEIPTSPLRRRLEEATENHEEIAKSESVVTPFVNTVWGVENSLENLITVTRAKHCNLKNDDLNVFLTFGLVVTPIVALRPINHLFSQLSNAGSFAEIATILTNHLEDITEKNDLRVAVGYVSQLDRYMTRILNDFMMNHLPESGLYTTSFIEDAPGLSRFLNEKFQGAVNTQYVNYQRAVLAHLFAHTVSSGDDVSQINDDLCEGAFFDNLVQAYSIVYINATAAELGYNVNRRNKIIDPESTPMLSRLVKAIEKTKGKTLETSKHLIVTSDDARYELHFVKDSAGTFVVKEI